MTDDELNLLAAQFQKWEYGFEHHTHYHFDYKGFADALLSASKPAEAPTPCYGALPPDPSYIGMTAEQLANRGKPAAPAQSGEPVAWMYSSHRGVDLTRARFDENMWALGPKDMVETPLYAAPQPAQTQALTPSEWAPDRIWLQREVGEGGSNTWCEDSQDEHEQAEYIRVAMLPASGGDDDEG